jgi:tetratricopeptide (TPR) repeat protein
MAFRSVAGCQTLHSKRVVREPESRSRRTVEHGENPVAGKRENRTRVVLGLLGWLVLAGPWAGRGLLGRGEGQETRVAGPAEEGGAVSRKEPFFEGLGPYNRSVTTSSEECQRYFNQGLNFLFAFNHDAAQRSFQQAAEIDPNCAMAWWGVAFSQGPHINRPLVDAEQARIAWEALGKARAESAQASPLERAWIEALAKRCAPVPPENREPLDRAYADAMRALWKANPKDPEIGLFFAESLMNLHPWDLYSLDGQPREGTDEIVSVIEAMLALDPNHPLANHLYIHAVEASAHPERAAAAADRLRNLQPGLSHNVHMPSHIDVRLGRWKSSEESNRRAIQADRRFLAVRSKPGFYGFYIAHNYHMLAYSAMMQGKGKVAVDAIDEMAAVVPREWAIANAAITDGYMVMPLEVRMRFGRWDEILQAPEPDAAFPLARALRHYARAVAYAAQDQTEEARAEQAKFQEARSQVPEERTFGNNKAVDLLEIAANLVEGEILYREGKVDAAFAALREAVRRQDLLRYSEPPDWIQPVRHALGAALLHAGRTQEAEQVYRDDLKRLPENGWSLFGLYRSLELQGKTDEAEKVKARWNEVWKDADITLSSSCLCLPGV